MVILEQSLNLIGHIRNDFDEVRPDWRLGVNPLADSWQGDVLRLIVLDFGEILNHEIIIDAKVC